ncbi:MAG: alcohol dehydrogenase (NADP+) [Candidatus Aldehydirespiratoraceae bacterium]|jgi:alcohol dehydrogenase (NADP+)
MRGVPVVKLASGDEMPAVGLGTFGSDNYTSADIAEAVVGAIDVGYRHIDCASVYGNEAQVGMSLAKAMAAGAPRDGLWITSKVWNDAHDRVEASCEQSLVDLGLDFLDLFLVHWPFPNHHEAGVDVDARDPCAVPYSHDRFMATWAQMERLVERGLVRNIGTSNMTVSKLTAVIADAAIVPGANEMELHPHFQQPELFDLVQANGIVAIGYSPIGSPSRPERDRTADDSVDIEDSVVVAAAQRLAVHPAVVCVLWQIQRGSVPIPFSVKRHQYEAMLDAVCTLELSDSEMAALIEIDRGCRLIKGQVFLWPEANDWADLWQ